MNINGYIRNISWKMINSVSDWAQRYRIIIRFSIPGAIEHADYS